MINEFKLLSTICAEDQSTWSNNIFLTFDIDWAHDEVIEDTLQICESYSAPATFFATHKSAALNHGAIDLTQHELGIHPNFNPLLQNKSLKDDFRRICSELKNDFPDARSVRSHSLCFGSLIQTSYEKLGLTHDSSIIIPYQENSFPLFPWRMWDKLVRVP